MLVLLCLLAQARPPADAITRAVEDFVEAPPEKQEASQRFWVWINDQNANPWNTTTGKAMTWRIREVRNKLCLLGSDKKTNPYEGDTSVEESLPILCLQKQKLPAPEGVDPEDFYAGWSGGRVRLSKPVKGCDLTSLEAANKLIEAEHGQGWGMAEFHDTSKGGWAWWAYWKGDR